jgi:hypothetical protein
LGNGDAIDYGVINPIIAQLNRLEDSNNAQMFYNFNGQYVQNSLDDKIMTLAFRKTFTMSVAEYYSGRVINIPFPNPFTEPPIVTATFDNYGNASMGAFLVPYLEAVSTASLNLGVLRVAEGWPNLPTQAAVNIIAVGPTAQAGF